MRVVDIVKRNLPLFLLTLLLGGLGVVIGLNFTGPERQLERVLPHLHATASAQFQREMGVLLGPGIVDGNEITYLHNGDEIFPAMLDAIRSAKSFIAFETYIYWSGEIGGKFADALIERSQAGVAVHVLTDWAGSTQMEPELIERLKSAGIEFEQYRPLRWYNLGRLNNRTHRKILVVDGKVAFTGGVGIADQWMGNAQDSDHWRDAHFKLRGPAVAQMQSVFNDNWIKTTGHVLQGEEYFPTPEVAGESRAQVFSSSPNAGSESMELMYLLSIASATSEIDIAASYFVPDQLATATLVAAMRRGVRLRIVLPGEHMDMEMVRSASRAGWGVLLREGAEIYEFRPTMFHNKVTIVDGLMTSVGSTNFDARSFGLNDEANLNVYDREFAVKMRDVFEADIQKSDQVTLDEWQDRPWKERLQEALAIPLSSQL